MQYLKSKFERKKFFIYGLAKSGLATLNFLRKTKSEITCWDDNILARKKIERKYLINSKKNITNKIFDFIVISPGINKKKCNLKKFLKKNNNKIITDLDIFFYFNKKNQIISITGTNGKSTTCKLLEEVFRKSEYNVQLGGNIGKPILSLKKKNKKTIFVIEVSSYQLEYTQHFKSNHAAILNISSDHLERHGTITNYLKTKMKIFEYQSFGDHSYVNLNGKFNKRIFKNFKKYKFKSKINKVNKFEFRKIFKNITNKYLLSQSNLENASFAIKIARNYKIKYKIILNALNKFKGLPHRQEEIFLNKNITCINDSKATSFISSLQSLQSNQNIFWILGGLPKMNDKFFLDKVKNNVICAYIIGKKTIFFEKKLQSKINFFVVKSLKNAVLKVFRDIKQKREEDLFKKKYTILFSPSAASFDQFENFEDRGNQFKRIVCNKMLNIN